MKSVTIHNGSKPVMVLSIHDCEDWREKHTKKINEMLHEGCGYHSIIYSGQKDRCVRDTKEAIKSKIDELLEQYSQIGIISIHRRHPKRRVHPSDKNYFEIGTLKDVAMNPNIKTSFIGALEEQGLYCDDNIKFTGGQEIRFLHRNYNNSNYKRNQKNEWDASQNKLQIAQVEINNSFKHPEVHYDILRQLGQHMEEYLTEQRNET